MTTSLKRGSVTTEHSYLCRLCIACRYIFNLWQLHQGVDSLAQWIEHWIFNWKDRVRFPRSAGNFFSYALFLCYYFHVVRTTEKFKWKRKLLKNSFWNERSWKFLHRTCILMENLSELDVKQESYQDLIVKIKKMWSIIILQFSYSKKLVKHKSR